MLSPVKIWRNQSHIAELVGKTGNILTWTVIRVPPSGFSGLAPYAVAVIALDTGKRITVQLVDCDVDTLSVGKKVTLVIRRSMESSSEGVIPYGIKAKLI